MTDWPTIVRTHGPLVWRTAFRLLNDHADAIDCFQKTFLSALELVGREAIRLWPAVLKRLATARGLEMLRDRYRRASEPRPDVAPDLGLPDPLDTAVAGELADRLRGALAELDPVLANVFCLICLEGLSNVEAAAQLGVTANHAGVRLHRAWQALREKLRAFDPKVLR
jgi:RNA polymerase sigma-70 factor (ECF subfamily)